MRITNETMATFGTATIIKVTVDETAYYLRAFNGQKLGPAFKTFSEAKKALNLKTEGWR